MWVLIGEVISGGTEEHTCGRKETKTTSLVSGPTAASPALRKLPPMDSSWASSCLLTLAHVDRCLAPKA